MASAGALVSKRRHSDISSFSPLSVIARQLLVAKCARGGTLVAHFSSLKSEIQSVRETVVAHYFRKQRAAVEPGEHRRRTGMRHCAWDRRRLDLNINT